jgi:hypothetical protein
MSVSLQASVCRGGEGANALAGANALGPAATPIPEVAAVAHSGGSGWRGAVSAFWQRCVHMLHT